MSELKGELFRFNLEDLIREHPIDEEEDVIPLYQQMLIDQAVAENPDVLVVDWYYREDVHSPWTFNQAAFDKGADAHYKELDARADASRKETKGG